MIRVYDTRSKSLIECDNKNIRYLGVQNCCPLQTQESEQHELLVQRDGASNIERFHPYDDYHWSAAAFLSGVPTWKPVLNIIEPTGVNKKAITIVVKSNGKISYRNVLIVDSDDTDYKDYVQYLCLSGDVPQGTIRFLGNNRNAHNLWINVFPRTRDFQALGLILSLYPQAPRKTHLLYNNTKILDDNNYARCNSFDDNLSNDNIGQMARTIADRKLVFNDMCESVRLSGFYQNILAHPSFAGKLFPFCDVTYNIPMEHMYDLFPKESILVRNRIATCIPMVLKCEDKFKKEFGYALDLVRVRVISPNDDANIKTFFAFFNVMTGMRGFLSIDPENIVNSHPITLFRWNKSYELFQNKEHSTT